MSFLLSDISQLDFHDVPEETQVASLALQIPQISAVKNLSGSLGKLPRNFNCLT